MKTRLIAAALFLIPLPLFVYTHGYADDVSKGRDYFLSQCVACHSFSCNRLTEHSKAPKLGGLLGRKVGGVEDFTHYSEGYRNSEIIWSDKTLDEFFRDPGKIDPNSSMAVDGKIDSAEVRKQLIAYLKTEDPAVNVFCRE